MICIHNTGIVSNRVPSYNNMICNNLYKIYLLESGDIPPIGEYCEHIEHDTGLNELQYAYLKKMKNPLLLF